MVGLPAILVEMTLKTGNLGMIAIGLCYLAAARGGTSSPVSNNERPAPTLCSYGLIGMLVAAAVGFVVCNKIWPNFYFDAVSAGKNTWLAAQGICVLVFFVGTCYAVAGIRRAAKQFQ